MSSTIGRDTGPSIVGLLVSFVEQKVLRRCRTRWDVEIACCVVLVTLMGIGLFHPYGSVASGVLGIDDTR